jgi:hypothetical protein
MTEIEYVGFKINERGRTFTKEKLNSVIELQKPIHAKELKSFLGLVNHFRLHIRNLSILTKPLEKLIVNYKKGTKVLVQWNPIANDSYESILESFKNCPILFS